jgi:cellulose synthase/poly-beta-1,6-N-acetylglucosamine synthase-like glycosyltransferase
MKPFVSVIVPCRNEAKFIAGCLQSILANYYPSDRLEVIVADGMSTDGTRALLEDLAARDRRLRLIDNRRQITPAALNLAIGAARGEIILRIDGHAVMPPDYIRRCVDRLESSGADNVGGTIHTVAQTKGPFSGAIVAALSSRFGVGNSAFRTTAGKGPRVVDTIFGGCWRREIFSRIGGFNEQLLRSQDLEFNLRLRKAGGRILLDPEIVCDYHARADLASFWSHNFLNGRWAVLPFGASKIVPVRPRHLIPLIFVLALAVSTVFPFPWSIAIPAVYAAVNLAASLQVALARRHLEYLALLPVAFASLHLAYGLGSAWGLIELMGRKCRERWRPEPAPPVESATGETGSCTPSKEAPPLRLESFHASHAKPPHSVL